MPVSDPRDRSLIAKIGAHERWAAVDDRTAATAPARAGLEQRFLREGGGDPVKAQQIRKAYFARLALASAQARRRRAQTSEDHRREAEAARESLGGAR